MRRPVWPSPAVMSILREDLGCVCDFCAPPDLASPLLVPLGAMGGFVLGGYEWGGRRREGKRRVGATNGGRWASCDEAWIHDETESCPDDVDPQRREKEKLIHHPRYVRHGCRSCLASFCPAFKRRSPCMFLLGVHRVAPKPRCNGLSN